MAASPRRPHFLLFWVVSCVSFTKMAWGDWYLPQSSFPLAYLTQIHGLETLGTRQRILRTQFVWCSCARKHLFWTFHTMLNSILNFAAGLQEKIGTARFLKVHLSSKFHSWPSKLRFSASSSSFSRSNYHPRYRPPKGVYLLNFRFRFFIVLHYLHMFRQSRNNHNNALKWKEKRNYIVGGK